MPNRAWAALVALCAVLAACEWAPRPNADSGGSTAVTPPTAPPPGAAPLKVSAANSTATRPAYNSGRGFFVSAGKLYDAKGHEFRMRGLNRVHYDSPSQPGLSRTGANTVRVFLPSSATTALQTLQSQHLANKEVVVPTLSNFPNGKGTSCDNDPRQLAAGVDWWVDNTKLMSLIDTASIINIANEWGPPNSVIWRDAYLSAIKRLRAAGYRATLMIDTGGCGQDIDDLVTYASSIFEADPDKNLIFSFHLYGLTPVADIPMVFARLGALQKNSGMVIVIGEFGPGRNIGPSPTLATPQEVVNAAEANDLGWLAWAWDDNDKDGGESDENWFSMTYHGPGFYDKPADLTEFGKLLVLDPAYSFHTLAKAATIF